MSYTYYLQNGPQISIDGQGLITKQATWMLVRDAETNKTALADWAAFESDVLEFAGKPGDNWKKPGTAASDGRISSYTSDSTFKVTDVQVDGSNRLYYLVSFSAMQNLSELILIGNVDVQIDNVNQKTISLTYQRDLATGALSELENLFDTPGGEYDTSKVSFNGCTCIIESCSLTAVSKTRYTIAVTLKDMYPMMVGRPKYDTNEFNIKTASVTWRYDWESYKNLTLPESGESADVWLGLVNSNYIVTSVACEPDGLLGYNITVNARAVYDKRVKTSESYQLNTNFAFESEAAREKSVTVTFMTDAENKDRYDDIIGKEGSEWGYDGLTVSNVSIEEVGKGEYEVTVELIDDEYTPNIKKAFQNSQNYLKNQVDVSVAYSEIVLNPSHVGYAKNINDLGYYAINNPPRTTFGYDITPDELMDISSSWTASKVVSAIKSKRVGFSWVRAVYGDDGRKMTTSQVAALNSDTISKIARVRLGDYVYAQPTQETGRGESVRNIYFIPWVAKRQALIYTKKSHRSSYPKQNGWDKPMPKSMIGKKIPTLECTVSRHYKGRLGTVLKKQQRNLFQDALDELKIPGITSYKTINLSAEEVIDNRGKIWTRVTRTLSGLRGYYWNHNYIDAEDF